MTPTPPARRPPGRRDNGAGSVDDDEIVDAEIVDEDESGRMTVAPDDRRRGLRGATATDDGLHRRGGAAADGGRRRPPTRSTEPSWPSEIVGRDRRAGRRARPVQGHRAAVQADFENYRKRVAAADPRRGRPGHRRSCAEALLPVLDATEAAYLRHPDEVGPLLNVLLSELRKQGLEALAPAGPAVRPERRRGRRPRARRGRRGGRRRGAAQRLHLERTHACGRPWSARD